LPKRQHAVFGQIGMQPAADFAKAATGVESIQKFHYPVAEMRTA
jgi:hypothetical protein